RPAEAGTMVVDDVPVDAEPQRVKVHPVAPEQRRPSITGSFECAEKIAADVGGQLSVRRFPPVSRRPLAMESLPIADANGAERRMRLLVSQVLVSAHRHE